MIQFCSLSCKGKTKGQFHFPMKKKSSLLDSSSIPGTLGKEYVMSCCSMQQSQGFSHEHDKIGSTLNGRPKFLLFLRGKEIPFFFLLVNNLGQDNV